MPCRSGSRPADPRELFVYILLALDQKTLKLAQVEGILGEIGTGLAGRETNTEINA